MELYDLLKAFFDVDQKHLIISLFEAFGLMKHSFRAAYVGILMKTLREILWLTRFKQF